MDLLLTGQISPRTGRPGSREWGASIVEWGATLLLIAAVVGVLIAAIPGPVTTGVQSAICRVFSTQCADTGRAGQGGQAAGRGGQAGPPGNPGPQFPGSRQAPQVPTRVQVDTERVLNETPIGREALQWARDHGVTIVYRPGAGKDLGAYYSDVHNRITIESTWPPEVRAGTVVHEVNHARNRNTPDPKKMKREEYVHAAIEEEVNGTVLEIKSHQQLQRSRGRTNRPSDIGLQRAYEQAYREAVARENALRTRTGLPPLSAEEAERWGTRAGRRRVRQAYDNGEVVTSNTGQRYPDYYGDGYDRQNQCVLWIFC
jgi:hypothetical protein